MKKFFSGKSLSIVAAAGCLVAAASNAFALALLDTTTAANAITAELTPAITAAMPIAGTIVAVGVGWKMFKRFTH
jgi:hypothetical protein